MFGAVNLCPLIGSCCSRLPPPRSLSQSPLTDVADGDAATRHIQGGQLASCSQLLQVCQLPSDIRDALGLNLQANSSRYLLHEFGGGAAEKPQRVPMVDKTPVS